MTIGDTHRSNTITPTEISYPMLSRLLSSLTY